jgi:choline dehydrogenase
MGFNLILDINAPNAPSDGLATVDATINEQQQRVSTFDAFLPREIAIEREKNLKICTGVIVSKLEFSDNQKNRRAEKVMFQSRDPKSQKIFSVKVGKEVIVCSGALGSPQVLMLRFDSVLFS